MNKKFEIAKGVFAQNPNLREIFVCENGNSFEAESRALEHSKT